MRFFGLIAAWLAILPSAFGWNATGHRIIAAIAYDRLTPHARIRVDDLLKHHPDYATILTRNAPTDPIPGFPDMKRHTNWHYYDTPYAPDGAAPGHQDPPHALSELPRLIREISKAPDDLAAYDLLWIEHIEGDLHQPLHCDSRFLKSQPKGDAGGNGVILGERRNLHSLWDGAAGNDISDAYIAKYAA